MSTPDARRRWKAWTSVRVSGYIDQISFKDGQLVKPGDVLFVVDPRPYQDVLDQDKANLQSADAQRQLKEANFARAQRLFQNNVTAKEEYDTSVAQRNQAEAEFVQARASVNSAALNVEFTEVKSPIQGRISRQLVTRGNLVQADSTILTKVVSVDPIYAYFNVDQRTVQKYYDQIQGGQRQDPRVSVMPVYLQRPSLAASRANSTASLSSPSPSRRSFQPSIP